MLSLFNCDIIKSLIDLSDPVVITGQPSNENVTQNEEASFFCTATANRGDLTMKWEVDAELYNRETCTNLCSQVEINDSNRNSKTSTLTINTSNMPQVTNMTYLNIVCVVNQTIEGSLNGAGTRYKRSEMAQLIVFPAATTVQPSMTTPQLPAHHTPPCLNFQPHDIYIITGAIAGVILIVIIILSLCIICILCYHFKNKQSQLGRRPRRTFSKDPEAVLHKCKGSDPSPLQLECRHFQGMMVTSPIIYTDTNAQIENGNRLVEDQQNVENADNNTIIMTSPNIENVVHSPDFSSVVTRNENENENSESDVTCTEIRMLENELYQPSLVASITLGQNPAYATNVAIAPEIETEENIAYQHNLNVTENINDSVV